MFENQIENYIGKALTEEAKTDGEFLTESELAFRVTGMMYTDKVKSDGPVSLRAIKGRMVKVRTLCDEKGMMLLPKVEAKNRELAEGETECEVTGWKIATGADLDYIGETFLGITVEEKTSPDLENNESASETE